MTQEEYLNKKDLIKGVMNLPNASNGYSGSYDKQDFLDLLDNVERVCVIKTMAEEYRNPKTAETTYTIKFKDYKAEIRKLLKECEEKDSWIRTHITEVNEEVGKLYFAQLELLTKFQLKLKEILRNEQ